MNNEYNIFAWVVGIVYIALAFLITLGVGTTMMTIHPELWELIIDFIFNAPTQLIFYFVE